MTLVLWKVLVKANIDFALKNGEIKDEIAKYIKSK